MKNGFLAVLTLASILCVILVWWPQNTKPLSLMSVTQQQQELVRRGHGIKIDGKFGPATDLALSIELSRMGHK